MKFIPVNAGCTREEIVNWINNALGGDPIEKDDPRLTDAKCQEFVDDMFDQGYLRDMDPDWEGHAMEDRDEMILEFVDGLPK